MEHKEEACNIDKTFNKPSRHREKVLAPAPVLFRSPQSSAWNSSPFLEYIKDDLNSQRHLSTAS